MILTFDTDFCTDGELRSLAEIYWKRADASESLAAIVPPGFEDELEEHGKTYRSRAELLEALLEARTQDRADELRAVADSRPAVVPSTKVGDYVRPCFNGQKGYTGAGKTRLGPRTRVVAVNGFGPSAIILEAGEATWICKSWVRAPAA